MIAVDTNILVYAHRSDSEWHEPAAAQLRVLAEGRIRWCILWPCVHEFLAIVTHPRIWNPPTPLQAALDQVDAWMTSPSVVLLAEGSAHWSELKELLLTGRVQGPRVHDARIAALCLTHGIREFWSADRDFNRFPSLNTHNPLAQ